VVEITCDNASRMVSDGVVDCGLKAAIPVAQKHSDRGVLLVGYRNVLFTIPIEITCCHKRRESGDGRIFGWLKTAITVTE
jgi:hypothetical protein